MGTPATTARQTPSAPPMKDGYQTLIAFAADPDVAFWEKTVQPPGLDGGDAIDTTTMHNSNKRTFAPRALTTMTDMELTVAYSPESYDQIQALINVETAITVKFPDGSGISFFGFLRTFEPDSMEEGSQPEASITITPTNVDPMDDTEADFDYQASVGT